MAVGTGVHNMSLVVRAKNRASRALAGVQRDLSLTQAATRGLGGAFVAAGRMATTAVIGIGAATTIMAGIGVRAFAQFEDAMVGSLAIMGDVSEEQTARMEAAARKLAKETRFSAVETAEAFFFLASAGLDVERSIAALPAVGQFAQAGLFDLSTATSLLTDAQAALGLKVEDAQENLENMIRVSDVLVGANTLADASTEQFAESLANKAAASARIYGISLEETVAVLAVFADNGLKGVAAGEAFAIVTRDLQKAALKNKDAWDESNLSVFDAEGNFRNIADIIGELEVAFDGLSAAGRKQLLTDLGFQERSQARLLQLIGSADAIRDNTAALEDMAGITDEVASKQLKSLSAQFDIFKSRINDVFISLGERLAPTIEALLPKIADWAERHGPALIDWTIMFFSWIGTATNAVIKFWREAIVPAIQKIQEWWQKGQEFKTQFIDAFTVVMNWFQTELLPFIIELWDEKIIPTISAALELAQTVAVKFIEFFQDVWRKYGETILALATDAWERIKDIFRGVFDFVRLWIDMFSAFFEGDWERVWGISQQILEKFWEIVENIFFAIADGIAIIVIVAVEALGDVWGKIWEGLKVAASAGWRIFVGWWTAISTGFFQAWDNAWEKAKNMVGTIMQGLTTVLKAPLNAAITLLERGINAAIKGVNAGIRGLNIINPFEDIPRVSTVSLPRLARGGLALSAGLAMVGERGPEVLQLPRGARVAPLSSSAVSDRQGGRGATLHIENLTVMANNPRELLEQLMRETEVLVGGE